MGKTKSTGRAGRFGARYGLSVRKRVKEVEEKQFKKHKCPRCLKPALKRVAAGIWECKKCGAKLAGGAYYLEGE